jgi:membrane protein implicated in regulation of membrane protease activity
MCHLLLLLPLVALPVFWIWPLAVAGPVYAGVVGVSGWVYYYAIKAMRRPVVSGREELIGSAGEVIETRAEDMLVRVHSELWSARCAEPLAAGDRVQVLAVDALTLKVKRLS